VAHVFRHFLDDIGHNNIIKADFDPETCDEASADAFARKEAQFKSINSKHDQFYTQVNQKMEYSDIGGIVVSQFSAKGLDRGLQEVDKAWSISASTPDTPITVDDAIAK